MIRLENASLQYGKPKEGKYLFRNLNLILPEKGLVILTGTAASALANVIGGLEGLSSGRLSYRGTTLSGWRFDSYRACVGFIFQKYFFQSGTVRENLDLQRRILKLPETDYRELLEKVNFRGELTDQVLYLNSGEMAKVNIAQALLKNPEILVAVDPTSGLSPEEEAEILETIKRLSEERLVVISTGKPELKKHADRVIELENGTIASDTAPVSDSEEKEKPLVKIKGFSLANALDIVWANVKRTPLYTAVFTLFALAFLAVYFTADVLDEFDGPALILEMMEEHQIDYGEIYKVETDFFVRILEMSEEDVAKIASEHPSFRYFKVLNFKHDYFYPDAKGIVEMPEQGAPEFHLLFGKLPKETNEFIVSRKFAEKLLNWTKLLGKPHQEIADLIGYTLPDYGNLKLVGIVEEDLIENYVYVKSGFLDGMKAELAAKGRSYCNYLYFKTGDDWQENYKIFSAYHGDNTYFIDPTKDYIIVNPVTKAVFPSVAVYYTANDMLEGLIGWFFIFPFIISFFWIPRALKLNRSSFWRKRVLGYRNRDFIAAFLIQLFLVFVIVLPIVGVFGVEFVKWLETVFYQMIKGFYTISLMNVLKILGFAFFFTALAVAYPVWRFFGSFPTEFVKEKRNRQTEKDYYLDLRFEE